jgi:hypothetical protein
MYACSVLNGYHQHRPDWGPAWREAIVPNLIPTQNPYEISAFGKPAVDLVRTATWARSVCPASCGGYGRISHFGEVVESS